MRMRVIIAGITGLLVGLIAGFLLAPYAWNLVYAWNPGEERSSFSIQEPEGLEDQIASFTEGLGRIVVWGKRGFIDKTGRVVIAPQFEEAWPFSEGLAAVAVGDKVGFIDRTGKMVIAPTFEGACDFSKGLAAVKKNGVWGFIDKKGKWVVDPRYKSVSGEFREGLGAVEVDGKWGYIDQNGKMVISPEYDRAMPFWGELALVKKGKYWGYIDRRGHLLIGFRFLSPGRFVGNSALVELRKEEGEVTGRDERAYAYITKKGDITAVLRVKVMCLLPFSEGLAMAQEASTGRCGYITPIGEWAIGPRFDLALSFTEGRARAWVHGKAGYIDKTGNFVIPPIFNDVRYFNEGLAAVVLKRKLAFIDRDGKFIWRQSEAEKKPVATRSAGKAAKKKGAKEE